MPSAGPLTALFVGDPVLGYSLLGALFLLAVSLAAGIVRQDFRALLVPRVALTGVLAVISALLLGMLLRGEPVPLHEEGTTLLAGFERLPLYLFALAYGPSPAVAVALLYGLLGPVGSQDYASAAVLLLEMVLLGWLAIFPSPREYRWAGPVDTLLGYTLAWATAGVAYVQWSSGGLRLENLLASHPGEWSGIGLMALCLFLVGPGFYARFLPGSRIDPEVPDEGAAVVTLAEVSRAGRRERSPAHRTLEGPSIPPELRRQPRPGRSRRQRQFEKGE